jgi:pyruvate/2-oxoglutarate dehydrogenase complex dihydrolipoamide acyltransferase (E2) component
MVFGQDGGRIMQKLRLNSQLCVVMLAGTSSLLKETPSLMSMDPDSSSHIASSQSASNLDTDAHTDECARELSPAVRRLIRQYDMDLSVIRGTGPDGRIRVSDVMAALGNRGVSGPAVGDTDTSEPSTARMTQAENGLAHSDPRPLMPESHQTMARRLCTLSDECEVNSLLAHVHAYYPTAPEVGLMLCVLSSCVQAMREAPEIAREGERLVAELTWGDAAGHEVRWIADTAQPALSQAMTRAWLAGRSGATREAGSTTDTTTATDNGTDTDTALALHWLGSAGASVACGLPVRAQHTASLAITAPQPKVVVDGAPSKEAARIRQVMTLMLTFDTDKVSVHRANHFLAGLMHRLHSAFSTDAMDSAT